MTNETEGITDHEAFLRLFSRFEGNLRAFVASFIPTWDGVDEVMQESSVVLWRKFDQFDAQGKAVYEDGVAIKDVAVQVGRSPTGLYKALARVRDRLATCLRAKLGDIEKMEELL